MALRCSSPACSTELLPSSAELLPKRNRHLVQYDRIFSRSRAIDWLCSWHNPDCSARKL